jgi:hypothetical protein
MHRVSSDFINKSCRNLNFVVVFSLEISILHGMRRGGIAFLGMLGIGALAYTVQAVNNDASGSDDGNNGQAPYSAIWLRNVFDLKPPPPPPSDADPKTNAPPSNVKLTGITTIFGKAQALFLVQQTGAPGKPPSAEESYILSVGDRQGGLEVLNINSKASTVRIKHDGLESTITFETNHPPSGGPGGQVSAPGAPGAPGQTAPGQRGTGMRPPGFPGSTPAPITRPMRSANTSQGGYSPMTPQAAGYAQPAYAGYPGGVQNGYVQPVATVNTGSGVNLGSLLNQPASTQQLPVPATSNLDPAEQAAILLAQQVAHAGQVYPPPLPGLPDPNAPEENASPNQSTGMPPLPVPGGMPPMPLPGARSSGTLSGAR